MKKVFIFVAAVLLVVGIAAIAIYVARDPSPIKVTYAEDGESMETIGTDEHKSRTPQGEKRYIDTIKNVSKEGKIVTNSQTNGLGVFFLR